MTRPLGLAVLISGGGTTFLNLHQRIANGTLSATIHVVVSSSAKAAGLQHAKDLGYPTAVVQRRDHDSDEAFSRAIDQHLFNYPIHLVVLGGFLKRYLPSRALSHGCINIHPALIPAFCGQGFYGKRVHQAVWERGCRVSGCTVHYVDDQYDHGPIIVQKAVSISPHDTPDDIQHRVFESECDALPEAIALIAADKIALENGRVIWR